MPKITAHGGATNAEAETAPLPLIQEPIALRDVESVESVNAEPENVPEPEAPVAITVTADAEVTPAPKSRKG